MQFFHFFLLFKINLNTVLRIGLDLNKKATEQINLQFCFFDLGIYLECNVLPSKRIKLVLYINLLNLPRKLPNLVFFWVIFGKCQFFVRLKCS